MLGRGNLADAERRLEEILGDARAAGERDVEARAEQGIAAAFYYMGQPAEGIPHAWQAFQLYEEDDSKLRALGDMGTMLLSLGDATGAERALAEGFRRGRTQETVSNAVIALMHCASYRRDHIGFARWRERCEDRLADMPPNIRADFYLKQGIGQARFGRFRRADVLMKEALAIAGAAGLHEFEFRIERILAGLPDYQDALDRENQLATELVVHTADDREG